MITSLLLSTVFLSQPNAGETPFQIDQDPGGCKIERVAVDDDKSSYQYDSLSPDGKSIAIAWDDGADARGTYLLNLETGQRQELKEFNNGASFSPDGKYLINSVYVENGKTDILEINRETGERKIIAAHDNWDWLPSYSPDGKYILFNSFRAGNSDIYIYERETEKLTQLTISKFYDAHAQFSPDGKNITFHRQVGREDFNIILLNIRTQTETQLTSSTREESYASWSRDGEHIFYSSDRDNEPGKNDIFVMTREGDEVKKLTSHPEKDAYSFASVDGEHLYFMSYRAPQGVYRMKIDKDFNCS